MHTCVFSNAAEKALSQARNYDRAAPRSFTSIHSEISAVFPEIGQRDTRSQIAKSHAHDYTKLLRSLSASGLDLRVYTRMFDKRCWRLVHQWLEDARTYHPHVSPDLQPCAYVCRAM